MSVKSEFKPGWTEITIGSGFGVLLVGFTINDEVVPTYDGVALSLISQTQEGGDVWRGYSMILPDKGKDK